MPVTGGMTIEEILAEATPRQRTVFACVDGSLQAERDELEHELTEARATRMHNRTLAPEDSLGGVGDRDEAVDAIEERLRDVRERMIWRSVPFRIRGMPGGSKAWWALEQQHRTDIPSVNPDGSPALRRNGEPIFEMDDAWLPAVLSACALAPAMTRQEARRLLDQVNDDDFTETLLAACIDGTFGDRLKNLGPRRPPVAAAAGGTSTASEGKAEEVEAAVTAAVEAAVMAELGTDDAPIGRHARSDAA